MESQMKCNISEMWSSRMPEGLELEISHHPLTMKHVANLIIATQRFKGIISESVLGTEFRDEHLLSIMLESIVEERNVFGCEATPPTTEDMITRTREYDCTVEDEEKRSLVRVNNSLVLHAVMLQGGTDLKQVKLNMSMYLHPAPSVEGRTVALGIKGTQYYLTCRKDGAQPTLHLETITKDSLASIDPNSDMVRFLFYKQISGVNVSTLMSVAHPNWYISTAEADNMPVEMCQESTSRYRAFTFSAIKEETPTA
ncbi:interleukin-1 beta-like [Epinephelus fuscoguttatus]|uniref:interleukin-1 beta-like n=1 Tax=Epinephelus fuscoguttatus TaxID=293821 RepID=UPI0020D1D797|nr:interleukin-1 beta-like [Epinephelus fuscoguttatus]